MSTLNPEQKLAVDTIHWPLLINAGAGSGKTHTITERVVSMIEKNGIDPRSIFCVTFTNKAAREMRERIGKRLGVDMNTISPFRNNRLPTVGTFHSVASFFLRMFIDRLGYSRDFVIYDSDDCVRLVRDILRRQQIDEKEFNPRWVHGMISQTKWKGMSPSEFSVTVDSYFGSVVLEVYKEYATRLKWDNALDFDDLLLLFRRILDIDEVKEYFHTRFQYFMVDEYQDTNLLQYEIVRILASVTRHLCVVGDDWQGIYSWRGADIQNILSFQKDYPDAKIINLEENYRSTKLILEAANAVIKNNTNQLKKNLFTSNPEWEKIIMLEWIDEKHEADLVTNVIRDTREDRNQKAGIRVDSHNFWDTIENISDSWSLQTDYSQFAILYRTNGQSRLIEESLIRKNIPYRVFGGVKFYERREVKDILAYMRLVFNPGDTMSLKRIINIPGRKIGEKTVDELMNILESEHIMITDLTQSGGFAIEWEDELTPPNSFSSLLDRLSTLGRKWVMQFLILYMWLHHTARDQSVRELMELIIKRTGYLEYLKAEYGEDEYEDRWSNIEEFLNMASRYDWLLYPENLASFLEDIALITDQDRENNDKKSGEKDNGYVSLMTIHLAKWLEYPTVFIVGAEEGIFPHSRSLLEAAAIEEERRLMYVAITRARDMLYISRAHERYTFGNYSANPRSRFVKEIPESCIEIESNRGSAQSIFGNGGSGFSGMSSLFTSWSNSTQAIHKPITKSKNDAASFAIGDRVKHPQYGVGTVITLREAIADIAFPGLGIKKMNVEIAPVEKL
jgi:DNA helicase II / ATP-dependent DNA helicase PcrA